MSLFTQKELSRFSVTKFLSEASNQVWEGADGELTGLEREASDALKSDFKRRTGTTVTENMLPIAALGPIGKAMNVTSALSGGFLVGEDLQAIVPALRSASVVLSLGAQVLDNLKSDVGLPAETAFQAASWLSESEALGDPGDPTYSKTVLSPKRCATISVLSKQLLAQNSLGIENSVRSSLRNTLGTAIDKAALAGVGNKEPLGLINNPGAGSVTFSSTATRAKAIAFQDALATANAGNTPEASLAYVTTPTTSSKWMQIAEVATYPSWLWQGNEWAGTVAGLPARATANLGTGNQVICGDWSKLALALWSEGFSVLSDPFAQKKSNLVEIYASVYADVAPVTASNFVVSTDSGAQ
jgi:HK97 family phage major capsid protein